MSSAWVQLTEDTLTSGIGCCSLNSVLVPISVETGISISTLVAGTGYSESMQILKDDLLTTVFLLLGWGGLITQPLAITFGKRPVYLMSQIGLLVSFCPIKRRSTDIRVLSSG